MVGYKRLVIAILPFFLFLSIGSAFSQAPVITPKTNIVLHLDANGNYTTTLADVAKVTSLVTQHPIISLSPTGFACTTLGHQIVTVTASNVQAATFNAPAGITIDAAGNMFVNDLDGAIRKVTKDGIVSTIVPSSDNYDLKAATGIAIDKDGNLFVAAVARNAIYKVTQQGVISVFSGFPGEADYTDTEGYYGGYGTLTNIAFDGAGNLYVSDAGQHRIKKVTPDGYITNLAGGAAIGFIDAKGPAAAFTRPWGIGVDKQNNVFVADIDNQRIRKITPDGNVTTLAGNGSIGSIDGPGATATFTNPVGLTVDALGNVFVTSGNEIRKITPLGVVSTVAGTGTQGSVDGNGMQASFNGPGGIAVDADGNLYVADTGNNKIRKIAPDGTVTTLAGTGQAGDSDGPPVVPDPATNTSTKKIPVTVISNPTFNPIADAVVNADANCRAALPDYTKSATASPCADKLTITQSPAPGTIVKAASAITVTLTASDGFGGKGTTSFKVTLSSTPVITPNAQPIVLTLDATGKYQVKLSDVATVSACGNPKVQITPAAFDCSTTGAQTVTVTAGTGSLNPSNPAAVQFNYPSGAVVDASGNIYIADQFNNKIKKIATDGTVTTLAGSGVAGSADGAAADASFNEPSDLVIDKQGNLYVADLAGNKIRKITPAGIVSTFAGSGILGFADGTGTAAGINQPNHLAIDNAGNLYVSDYGNNRIRKITPAGVVSTIAGTGALGAVNGPGATATFNGPFGICIDGAGNVYVSDVYNSLIRKITPGGVVSTYAGTGVQGHKDGAGNIAQFYSPGGLLIDASGNVYVAEDNDIRKIDPAGNVTTLVTDQPVSGSSITFDNAGNIIVCDRGEQLIKSISKTGQVTIIAGTFLANGDKNGNIGNSDAVSVQIPVTIKTSLAITSVYTNVVIPLGNCPATMPDFIKNATAADNCSNQIVFTQTPGAGTVLTPNQVVKVTITANDDINGTDSKTFNVTASGNAPMPSISISGTASVCAGAQATFNAIPVNSSSPSYQWQVNGVNAGGDNATFSSASLNDNDVVTCILVAGQSCTTPVTSNAITVKINPLQVPTISIAANKTAQCAGSPVSFSATAGNAGTNPQYKWTVNGTDAGTNSATLTLAGILPADVVKCLITSDSPCPASAESNTVTNISTIDNITPSISIQSSVAGPVCNGTPVKFTATPVNEGSNPTYQWQLNGANQGSNTPDFTISNFADRDVVTCVLKNNSSPCLTNPTAHSNAVSISVIPPSALVPSVTISPDAYEECTGVSLTFKAIASNAGDNPAYQWKVNGQNVGANTGIFNSSSLKTGDKISCTVTSSATCSLATATSNEALLIINPVINNSVTISSSALNNISSPNQQIVFTAQASYNTNTTYQWQVNNINAGTNSPEFTADNLVNGDVVTCLLTTTGKCVATQVVTSNAIVMIIYVPIVVVNTFTPNGDGINDTWEIPMLRTYPNCQVSVFSRYGMVVYNSVGYSKAWDGMYKHIEVPTGTYYYIIDLKNGKGKISGSVTVIR